jgi:hypothetical protein
MPIITIQLFDYAGKQIATLPQSIPVTSFSRRGAATKKQLDLILGEYPLAAAARIGNECFAIEHDLDRRVSRFVGFVEV